MTAPAVPPEKFPQLLFNPPATASAAEQEQLGNMKFDSDHWRRAFHLCMGRGGTVEQCKKIPMDTHITPQNPLPYVFKKEVVDAIECMTEHGDHEKCYHYTEYFSKTLLHQDPPAGKWEKVTGAAGKIG